MPVIDPGVSTVNLTPTSVLVVSGSDGLPGVTELLYTLQGQLRGATVTGTDVASPMFALSSVARALRVALPAVPGDQVYDHVPRPLAGCQVEPPSVDTSTPPTTPPPESVAVPETVRVEPDWTVAPADGEEMVVVGFAVSVDAVAATSPAIKLPGAGWTPMSARRLTVACCMDVLAAAEPLS